MRRFMLWLLFVSLGVALQLFESPKRDYLQEADAFLQAEVVRVQPLDGRSVDFEASYRLLSVHSSSFYAPSRLEIGTRLQREGFGPVAQFTLRRITEHGVVFECTVIDPNRPYTPGQPTASGEIFVPWKGGEVSRWQPTAPRAQERDTTGQRFLPQVTR